MNVIITLSLILISLPASAKVVDKILATVNNGYIAQSDYNEYLKKLKAGSLVDPTLFEITKKEELLKSRKKLIDHLINEKILENAVKSSEIIITIERVEQEIRTITRSNKIDRKTLIGSLKSQGIKFSDYQDFIKNSLERKMLIEDKINLNVKVSNDDVISYYLSNSKGKKAPSFKYKLNQIYILKQNGGDKLAHKRAQIVSEKLKKANVSFEKISKQHSEYGTFVPEGEAFESSELLKEIDSVVRSLPVGEFSGVINTKKAYILVRLLDRSIIEDPELIENKPKIQFILRRQLFAKEFKKWLKKEKESSFIRIN